MACLAEWGHAALCGCEVGLLSIAMAHPESQSTQFAFAAIPSARVTTAQDSNGASWNLKRLTVFDPEAKRIARCSYLISMKVRQIGWSSHRRSMR